jgi:nucleoside-diphosphate-sugar epimerase
MKVLVTGAGGFLGRAVVDALRRARHDVRALIRGDGALLKHDGVHLVRGDLLDAASMSRAADGVDAAIHLGLAMQGNARMLHDCAVDGTRHLVQAMAPGTRLVLASSFSVYDWQRVGPVLTESAPTWADRGDTACPGAYARAKCAQELGAMQAATRRQVSVTVLRPAMVWGSGHPGLDMVGPAVGRWRLLVRPQRAVLLTHVENCAEAFVAALGDTGHGEVFNVEDGMRMPVAEHARRVAADERRLPVPSGLLGLAALGGPLCRLLARSGLPIPGLLLPERLAARFPLTEVDTTKIRERLGWRPRHEGVYATTPQAAAVRVSHSAS